MNGRGSGLNMRQQLKKYRESCLEKTAEKIGFYTEKKSVILTKHRTRHWGNGGDLS